MTFEMTWTWRCVFLMFAAAGLAGVGYGVAGLTGLVEGEESRGELIICVVVGLLVLPFSWTGLRHARLVITEDELVYLGLGALYTG